MLDTRNRRMNAMSITMPMGIIIPLYPDDNLLEDQRSDLKIWYMYYYDDGGQPWPIFVGSSHHKRHGRGHNRDHGSSHHSNGWY